MYTKPALTPDEVGRLMGVSAPTVRRLFANEPGVLWITRPARMHKRRYRTMRIPRAVYDRVRKKMEGSKC
jgi:hypothetical protein